MLFPRCPVKPQNLVIASCFFHSSTTASNPTALLRPMVGGLQRVPAPRVPVPDGFLADGASSLLAPWAFWCVSPGFCSSRIGWNPWLTPRTSLPATPIRHGCFWWAVQRANCLHQCSSVPFRSMFYHSPSSRAYKTLWKGHFSGKQRFALFVGICRKHKFPKRTTDACTGPRGPRMSLLSQLTDKSLLGPKVCGR